MNRFWDKIRVGMLCVNYTLVMALLSIIIFGATQQKANGNVSVTYSRPSYTVTFDPQGGGVSPSQKTVKLGDNYGDLPTPTRDGYTFVRWAETGKNLCYFAPTGEGYSGNSSSTKSLIEREYTKSEFTKNTRCSSFYFSFDYEIKYTSASELYFRYYVRNSSLSKWTLWCEKAYPNRTSGRVSVYCSINGLRQQIKFAYCTSDSACSIYMRVFNIQIESSSSSDAATDYEPYMITSGMQYTKQSDQTLKAIWKENTYTVTFENNYNLLSSAGSGSYNGNNCKITWNNQSYLLHINTDDDPYATISQTVYLEKDVQYDFHAEIRDGPSINSALSTDGSIQIFYAVGKAYNETQSVHLSNDNQLKSFTAPETGTYNIRFDNDYHKDVYVYCFSIKPIIWSRNINYDRTYGSPPSNITRSGYTAHLYKNLIATCLTENVNSNIPSTYNSNENKLVVGNASLASGNSYSGAEIQIFDNYSYDINLAGISRPGVLQATFTKSGIAHNKIRIKGNGNLADAGVYFDLSHLPDGQYVIYCEVTSATVSATASGRYENFVINRICLEFGDTFTGYFDPVEITSSTIMTTANNHNLVAVWKASS